ncbi:MAG TPA: MaoC/PaaZ C-terminal domain-containing protein [Acidimicrobiales bacterium]|nr:MaoC/PaaZ C-terminal domain-containing protein [Acidimicrobiales bacterium]
MIPGVDYHQRYWEDVAEGEELAPVEDEITYRRVVMNPATTWDYFPGHHDPEYAKAQGQPTIYINTMHFLGFIDRLATAWGGPASFITRRKMSMRHSIYAGDTMVGQGRVVRKYTDEPGGRTRHLVELEITVENQDGQLCVPATVHLELPARQAS